VEETIFVQIGFPLVMGVSPVSEMLDVVIVIAFFNPLEMMFKVPMLISVEFKGNGMIAATADICIL